MKTYQETKKAIEKVLKGEDSRKAAENLMSIITEESKKEYDKSYPERMGFIQAHSECAIELLLERIKEIQNVLNK